MYYSAIGLLAVLILLIMNYDVLLRREEAALLRRELAFIRLEVRECNLPAVSLYKKHGYVQAGRRKDYYTRPKEDALIFTKYFR